MCCNKTLTLPQSSTCRDLVTGLSVLTPGIWELRVNFLGAIYIISKSFVLADPLSFPLDGIDEDQEFTAQIFQPGGTLFNIPASDGTSYDCVKFQTKLEYAI